MLVRPETDRDLDGIREVNIAAFRDHPFSQQTEHLIVEALRAADALEVSLVAESEGEVVGHIAFSAAAVGDSSAGWFVLGPVAVRPTRHGEGIGRALVEAGLEALRSRGACGCVLVGDPAFYGRFGFRQCPGVTWHSVPDENALCLPMSGEMPAGEVVHHPAFLAGTQDASDGDLVTLADHRVAFDAVTWEVLAPGARHKVVRHADTVLRLVEFTREFVEPDWCVRGHVGYVLAGDLSVDFDGAPVRFAAGDGIFIPPGEQHRHKAVVAGDVVRLVLVERV